MTPDEARSRIRTPARTRRTTAEPTTWRTWWEYNREDLLGLRALIRRAPTLTPDEGGGTPDPLGALRADILDALRTVATKETDRTLRASAMIALGRMGDTEDARIFLYLLRRPEEPSDVHEAAALALGLLPRIGDAATAEAARAWIEYVLDNDEALHGRARGILVVASGWRARQDKRLLMGLAGRCASRVDDEEEGAALALACGLSEDAMVLPELLTAARRADLGGVDLNDIARAHAVTALGHSGQASVSPTLRYVLVSARASLETRRAAALSLGRLLRRGILDETAARQASGDLLEAFRLSNDPVLRGFCAVAMGSSTEPLCIEEMARAIDHGGAAEVKPFAALGLACLARGRETDAAKRIRALLRDELEKTNDPELQAAFSIAVGLAGASDARKALIERVSSRLPAPSRAAAAQALGLLGAATPDVVAVLQDALLSDTRGEIAQDAALALGLLGQRGVVRRVAAMLRDSESEFRLGRLMLSLGYLGGPEAAAALLEILRDGKERGIVREFAAAALGLIGDPRERDLLMSLDADFNYFATLAASNEILRLF